MSNNIKITKTYKINEVVAPVTTNFILPSCVSIVSKEFIEIDKEGGSELESHSVIYSLMLRLRGLFLIKCLISDEKYSKKSFEKWILSYVDKKEFDICYEIYRLEKDEKPSKMIRIRE
jgi:hypothetical protein